MRKSPTPRRRLERPAKAPLSREAVIGAAIRLMESDGGDRLTMRRLAAVLQTGPASLYAYVRNTAELYAHILDDKLGTLDLDWDPERTPWLERLSALLMAYVEMLVRYPDLARSALLTRPAGENYLALVESLLALLIGGGAPPKRAAWGVDVLLQTATATAVEVSSRRASDDEAAEWEALSDAVRDAPADRFPLIAGLGLELVSGSGPARGTWALEAVANGIVATPRPDDGS